jgi:hypothetical protein
MLLNQPYETIYVAVNQTGNRNMERLLRPELRHQSEGKNKKKTHVMSASYAFFR